ncbi:hypothetical protein BT96DRAFT_998272 [Gymnopus androsaceus JB14]|uniref:Uncharacterized protein n=1 Tax=Gymnopus androsaceus JB14 TaxID=1447944 RepID=A0A6A4HBU8_9AGAR|nr:hypothetical protein BT96DRAFT_998272 [Gymnopus androsaceus JB14]
MSTIEEDRKVPPNIHHFISSNKNHPIHLSEFLHLDKHEDPAKKNFYRKLKDHPLGCLLEQEFDGDTHKSFTDEQCKSIVLFDNKMFATKTLRINFTMYDVHQDQDVINPCTDHCNVMVHSPDMSPCAHPFWYAGVLGIFHANVVWLDNEKGGVHNTYSMEFLWVRWLGEEPGYQWGIKEAKLPKVGFVPETDEYVFDFLDVLLVVQACHLMPDFASGRTSEDMFMRHLGGGVGHIDAQATTTVNTSGGPVDEDKDNLGRPNEHGDSDSESEDNDSDLERSLSDGGSNNDLGPDDGEDTDDSDGGYGSM